MVILDDTTSEIKCKFCAKYFPRQHFKMHLFNKKHMNSHIRKIIAHALVEFRVVHETIGRKVSCPPALRPVGLKRNMEDLTRK